jgi:hypothetical protein
VWVGVVFCDFVDLAWKKKKKWVRSWGWCVVWVMDFFPRLVCVCVFIEREGVLVVYMWVNEMEGGEVWVRVYVLAWWVNCCLPRWRSKEGLPTLKGA